MDADKDTPKTNFNSEMHITDFCMNMHVIQRGLSSINTRSHFTELKNGGALHYDVILCVCWENRPVAHFALLFWEESGYTKKKQKETEGGRVEEMKKKNNCDAAYQTWVDIQTLCCMWFQEYWLYRFITVK